MLGISVIKELNTKHSQSWHKKAINRRSGVGLLSAVSSIDNGSTFCKKKSIRKFVISQIGSYYSMFWLKNHKIAFLLSFKYFRRKLSQDVLVTINNFEK